MPFDDYYSLFGVKQDASLAEIRSAYRKLVLECHPDRNPGDAVAEARFKRLSAAYQTLSSDKDRAIYNLKYDSLREAQRRREEALKFAAETPAVVRSAGEGPRAPRTARVKMPELPPENRFRQEDLVLGMGLAALSALGFSWFFGNRELPQLAWAGALPPLMVIANLVGRRLREALEAPSALREDWMDELVAFLPSILVFSVVALFCGGVRAWNLALPVSAMPWAALGGGAGGSLGAGLGRAFWGPSQGPGLKLVSLSVGAATAVMTGGIAAMLIAFFGGGFSFDLAFYDLLFAAGLGGAAGGSVASLRGTWYKP